MYFLCGFLLLICIVFFLLNRYRKKQILQKLCCMDTCEKIRLLNELANPFGFSYLDCEDIMTSTLNAWQRQFGYCALFDKSAPRFNMVFDCEPIYFSWQDQTWLIEFWKGQYGINAGAEIGIYQADGQISPKERSTALFHSIPDRDLLPISMELVHRRKSLFSVRARHWWLTGFCMGSFAKPQELTLNLSITFPNCCMLQSFVDGMLEAGYERCELNIRGLTVSFCFSAPKTMQPKTCRFTVWLSNCQNRLFCFLYRRITRPCSCTLDRILFLYFYLPAAFRHMLRIKRIPRR